MDVWANKGKTQPKASNCVKSSEAKQFDLFSFDAEAFRFAVLNARIFVHFDSC